MKPETRTYTAPRVERFGTLRELTQVGCTAGGDGIFICRVPDEGCEPKGPPPRDWS